MERLLILTFILIAVVIAGIWSGKLKTTSFVFLLLLLLGTFWPKVSSTDSPPLIFVDSYLDRVIAINCILFFLWFLTALLLITNIFFFSKKMLLWFSRSYINFSEFFSSIFLIFSLFIWVGFLFPIFIYTTTLDLLFFCFVDAVKLNTIPSGICFDNFLPCLNIQVKEVINLPVASIHIGDAPAAFVFNGDEGCVCTQYGKFFSYKLEDGTLIGKIKVFVASSSLKLAGYNPEYTCVKLPSELLNSLSNCESCKK